MLLAKCKDLDIKVLEYPTTKAAKVVSHLSGLNQKVPRKSVDKKELVRQSVLTWINKKDIELELYPDYAVIENNYDITDSVALILTYLSEKDIIK